MQECIQWTCLVVIAFFTQHMKDDELFGLQTVGVHGQSSATDTNSRIKQQSAAVFNDPLTCLISIFTATQYAETRKTKHNTESAPSYIQKFLLKNTKL